MFRRFAAPFAFAVVAFGTVALAEDEILIKGKAGKVKNFVVAESAKGIVLKNGDKFSAEDIDDILYDLPQSTKVLAAISYSNAFNSERAWQSATDPKKRAAAYSDALDKYEKAALDITDKKVKAHLDFKIGYLRGKKALEDSSDPKNAISRLRGYVSGNTNSWQITRALLLLAKLQNENKDFGGAAESFGQLMKLDVSEDVKNDARLQGSLTDVQLGQYAAAEAKLTELMKTLPKGSKAYARAMVAQAECLIAGNKVPEGIDMIKNAIKTSDDKMLRAVAYNALGANYFKAEQYKEARWEFLWVDVVYNQDKAEHARALYYLSHIFDRLADPDKAAQCRATLLEGTYTGTEYHRKLQKEQAK